MLLHQHFTSTLTFKTFLSRLLLLFLVSPLTSTLAAPTPGSYISSTAFSTVLDPTTLARALTSKYPNPSLALFSDFLWWESGTALDALITYTHATGDAKYTDLIQNTLLSQSTGAKDFSMPDATGNDDQAWWALAAMSAAEYSIGNPGGDGWIAYARAVFEAQKKRWDPDVPGQGKACGGGLRWKIFEDASYRSTISNALFFQLAARVARYMDSADARWWAQTMYSWISERGLVDEDGGWNVYDGTSDSDMCTSVNHDLWSYNTGAMMYGTAVMWDVTREPVWLNRTRGLVGAARKNFVDAGTGRLWERKCENRESTQGNWCNKDQVAFKGILGRWMGATALLVEEVRNDIVDMLNGAVQGVATGWSESADSMAQFTALETVDALIVAGGGSSWPAKGAAVEKRAGMDGTVWIA